GKFFSIKEGVSSDFRATNSKSAKARSLEHNVFDQQKKAVLKTEVLYGANASGKSNIIHAIRFCHAMVIGSHIHNENDVFNFKPFKFDGYAHKPSSYFIRFVSKGVEYEYAFSLTPTAILT